MIYRNGIPTAPSLQVGQKVLLPADIDRPFFGNHFLEDAIDLDWHVRPLYHTSRCTLASLAWTMFGCESLAAAFTSR